MSQELRVLLLARFFLSGQTTHLVTLAQALQKVDGVSVYVATTGVSHPKAWTIYSRDLLDHGIPTFRANSYDELAQAARRFSPTVIHTHSSDLLPITSTLARTLSCASVFTCHGLGVPRRQPDLGEMDAIIAVGPKVMAELQSIGLHHVHIVGNGVDLNRFHPETKEKPWQVMVLGRVDSKKRRGLQELVRAFDHLSHIRLTIASNDRPVFASRARTLGWLDDPAPYLRRSHVVFGTGRAIREGMASGCVAFVLGEKYGGMIGPRSNSREDLPSFSGLEGAVPHANQIRVDLLRLFQDESTFHRLSSWSREYALSHFCLEDVASKTVAIYHKAGATV